MEKADCFYLGYVAKLHGFKGEVSLFFDVTNPNDYSSLDAVFIDINDQLTPFFVSSLKLKNNGFAQVRFEGLDDENSAKKLLRKELYLPASVLPKLEGNHFYDHEVVGFKVIDASYGEVGKLEQVVDFKVNPLFQIMNGDKEILIPILEDTVLKVNRKDKELHVQTPDGLIALYLEG